MAGTVPAPEALLIGLGGACGAVCRYAIGQVFATRTFPWATLVVNVLGSLLLGIVVFGSTGDGVALAVGVGFCGAFTTFSSFSVQTVALWERGNPRLAAANAVGNLVVSLLGFGVAWVVLGA